MDLHQTAPFLCLLALQAPRRPCPIQTIAHDRNKDLPQGAQLRQTRQDRLPPNPPRLLETITQIHPELVSLNIRPR